MADKELDRKERKRLQNRIAQRTYRKPRFDNSSWGPRMVTDRYPFLLTGRTQKERIQTLEAAITNVAPFRLVSPVESLVVGNGTEYSEEQNRDETTAPSLESVPSFQASDWDTAMSNGQSFSMLSPPQPPLHRAVRKSNEPMTRLLLKHGADVSKLDIAGNTALHLAAELGTEDMIRLLLDNAADPAAVNYLGHTPLMSAVQSNNKAAAALLLEGSSADKIDVNWASASGMTALHVAVECGFESMAGILIRHGADVNA